MLSVLVTPNPEEMDLLALPGWRRGLWRDDTGSVVGKQERGRVVLHRSGLHCTALRCTEMDRNGQY